MNQVSSALLLLSFFTYSNFILAEHTGAENPATVHGAPDTKVPTYEDLLKFKGLPLKEDKTQDLGEHYLSPNEYSNHVFEACLPSEGGAYISVGTFRGFNIGSSGKVSHLFLLDYDKLVVAFNALNVQLLAKANNRDEYLSYLRTGSLNPEYEKAVKENPKLSFRERLSKLGSPLSSTLVKNWKSLGISLSEEQWRLMENQSYQVSSIDFNGFENLKHLDYTFLENDERFNRLHNMALEGRITVLNGDLAGSESLASIGDALREKGMKVSGLDVSNVPSWFEQTAHNTGKPSFDQLMKNAKNLPFNEKGRLYLTAFSGSYSDDVWNYYAVKPESLPKLESFFQTTFRGNHDGPWSSNLRSTSNMPIDPSNKPGEKYLRTFKGEECI